MGVNVPPAKAEGFEGFHTPQGDNKKDLLDIFLEEILPVMRSPAWDSDLETRKYLTERAKERARERCSEQNWPKTREING